MKKIATTVLFFIIALSSTGCGQKNVIGTYCTGEGLSREDVYVSLLSDNTFLIYRQLETGLPGEFDSEEFENFTALTFHLEDGRQLLAAYDSKYCTLFISCLYGQLARGQVAVSLLPRKLNSRSLLEHIISKS